MKKMLVPYILLLAASCAIGPDVHDGMTYDTSEGASGKKMTVSFERGPDFINTMKQGFMTVKLTPQLAVWIEDTNGTYLKTVFVTAGFGDQKWKYFSPKGDSCGRTMCMPYWLGKYKAAGNAAPTPSKPLPDAVTGATPTGAFSVTFTVPEAVKAFKLFVEWNRSFDYNATYTKATSSFNGQPPVIAGVLVDLADSTHNTDTLKVIGRGGESGADGNLYEGVDKLTTALQVFGAITVRRR